MVNSDILRRKTLLVIESDNSIVPQNMAGKLGMDIQLFRRYWDWNFLDEKFMHMVATAGLAVIEDIDYAIGLLNNTERLSQFVTILNRNPGVSRTMDSLCKELIERGAVAIEGDALSEQILESALTRAVLARAN